jgi:hypothetical protein
MLAAASPSRDVLPVSQPSAHTDTDDLALTRDPNAAVDTTVPNGVRLALERQWAWWPIETDIQEQLYNGHPAVSIACGTSQCTHVVPFFDGEFSPRSPVQRSSRAPTESSG